MNPNSFQLPPRSERLKRSLAEGERKAETCAINESLSTLQRVFETLASSKRSLGQQQPLAHVPYRDSKLTFLLKPCLSKGGKAVMFCHVSPEQASANESLASLRFATKVRLRARKSSNRIPGLLISASLLLFKGLTAGSC